MLVDQLTSGTCSGYASRPLCGLWLDGRGKYQANLRFPDLKSTRSLEAAVRLTVWFNLGNAERSAGSFEGRTQALTLPPKLFCELRAHLENALTRLQCGQTTLSA
jgi:hypothetical protein